MIENVSTQLTVFHCLCPLPASRKGLRLTLRSALFGKGGRDWRPCICHNVIFFSGASNFCLNCGHGGHTKHLLDWFKTEQYCPTGCGCLCLKMNPF